MDVLLESARAWKLFHSVEVPGLAVFDRTDAPVALEMKKEPVRFLQCFPYLQVVPSSYYTIREKKEVAAFFVPGESITCFSAELDADFEARELAMRLLLDSVLLFEECYGSFPQCGYDYYEGEKHAPWEPSSAEQAKIWLAERFNHCGKIYNVCAWNEQKSLSENVSALLEALLQNEDFRGNRPVEPKPNDLWCACRAVRSLTEAVQQCGRRLYRMGISAFGREVIRDSFHFEMP